MRLKEQKVGLRDEITHDNLQCCISRLRKEQHCRQQVNAVIAVFHVHGVSIFTWLFKNAGVSYAFGQLVYTYVTGSSY